ncbi:MAG: peroxidase [Deltaproteobacteria bacterium]|nr:peroxidase [Deltaproteobacteria bacterium]
MRIIGVVLAAALSLHASSAGADGEVDYRAGVCGGAHGSPPPSFSTLIDLPYIFTKIQEYALFPGNLYGTNDPWTTWWRETDMRKALAKLAAMRGILEKNNLWDTYRGTRPVGPSCSTESMTTRQVDGTCNDQAQSWMGSVGARFGRNMDPNGSFAQGETTTLMSPSPREVSRNLFTRGNTGIKPVPFLNLLAAAWIQFQIHDWFSHTTSTLEFYEVPLAANDPLRLTGQTTMKISKTALDPSRAVSEAAQGPTYPNEVTHWWDGSQIYGSNAATANRLRTFQGGKLAVTADGLLPTARDGFEDTGFRNNWWLGLGLLHNLFAQEHNAIATMLASRYPAMTDQQLFDKARMITAAVMVKIHTVEWTPAILPNPTLEVGMNANWYGLNKYLTPKLLVTPSYVPLPERHVIFGMRGGARQLHKDPQTGKEVPFALSEEFVSVYRMHTLLPDTIPLVTTNGQRIADVGLGNSRNADARKLEEKHGMKDLLFSFGIANPGGLVLNNYPVMMQALKIPFLDTIDMGAVDVLRDRERGVPRYNEFRRQFNLMPLDSIDELTDDPALRLKIKQTYGFDSGAIERVDLLVGTLAEGTRPTCYGFGETLFQVFTLMASRRIHADRFYTTDYNATTYTQAGLDWIDATSFKTVLLRHYPQLAQTGLANVTNAFYPWD